MKKLLFSLCILTTAICYAKNIVKEFYLTQKDGVKLYTLISVPKGNKKFPVIVERSAYAKGNPEAVKKKFRSFHRGDLHNFVRVFQHCRGIGKSEGYFIPYINERNDGLALLEWIRKQDFYNGEIYLSGGSYGASVHGSYLNTMQPDIKGIFWNVQDTERYNIIYRNGFLRLRLHVGWYFNMYKKGKVTRRKGAAKGIKYFPLAGITERMYGAPAADFEAALLHPDQNDPFWKTPGAGGGEYSDALVNSRIPTFFVCSWHDLYITGMIDIWRKLDPEHRKKCVFVITPFDHASFGRRKNILPELYSPGGNLREYAPEFEDLRLSWFKHLRSNTPLKPFVKGKISHYVLFGERWVISDDIGSNSKYRNFHLTADRKLCTATSEAGRITYIYDPRDPASFKGGCHGNGHGVMLQDPPNSRQDIISFISEPFKEERIIEGDFKGKLYVTSTAPDTCFYLRLSVVKNGRAFGLRNEIDSICRTNPGFTPGKEAVIDFKIAAHHFKLSKGDRLRLDVSSSCWPYFQLHSNFKGIQALQKKSQRARNTIVTGKSYISIPFANF